MATSQGSPILDEDLQSWYTSLNTIISNYGGGLINELTIPGNNEKASSSHINNFLNKMTEMKADEYLGSVTSIYPSYSIVNSGTLIQNQTGNVLASATTSAYLGQIKCRNKATYSHANNQHGTKGNTVCGSGTCNSGTKQHSNKQHGNKQHGANQNGTNQSGGYSSNGGNSYRAKGNGCSSSLNRTLNSSDNTYYLRSTKTHGMYNPNTYRGNGTKGNGTCGSGTCGSGACGSGTCGSGTCGSGTNQHGNKQHGTCGSGVCSSGAIVDILNVNKTKG